METEFETITQGNHTAGLARKRIKEDLKTLIKDAESLIKETAGDMSDKAREARTRLQATLATAKENCQVLQDKTVAAAKATDRTIRSHPYESIGIALGLGLVVGVLVARRR
jgi:ElaB/YqjD/DUF883 family membrane-anchored ribosome-binding protein